jgi:hypothetical protein
VREEGEKREREGKGKGRGRELGRREGKEGHVTKDIFV